MRLVRPTNTDSLNALHRSVEGLDPTYDDVGATFSGAYLHEYHSACHEIELGHGQETFERSVMGLKEFRSHRTKCTNVFPESARVEVGQSVIVMIGTRAVSIAAPCRIVKVVDEECVFGFAYGTLPGHPENGEESFVIRLSPSGAVSFEIRSFSRAQGFLVKLSGPIARLIQIKVTKRYLNAIRGFVQG